MLTTAKIEEFTARARDEIAHRANDNLPPEKVEKVERLMQAVLHPQRPLSQNGHGRNRPLNAAELSAVRSLIEHQAGKFGVMARLITLAVEIAFEVDDLASLNAAQFDTVTSYLVYLHERCAP